MIAMLRRRWPVFLLLIAPLLALWRAVFLGQAVGAFDQIRQMAPWNGPSPTQPWDVLQADGVLQFYVWRDLVFQSWGNGVPPFWNPYQLAGTPLLANSQSAGLYPVHILFGVLHVPTPVAMWSLLWLHLAWASLGVYALVRSLGGTQAGGAISGLLFGLSPFMLAWAGLPSVVTTVSWIPWVLLGVQKLYSCDRAARGTGKWVLALSVAMLVLAGHLQFVAYGLFAAVLFAIGKTICSRSVSPVHEEGGEEADAQPTSVWRSFAACALFLGLGIGISAPQLLPVLKYSEFSHRRNVPTEEGYQAYLGGAISPTDFVSRLVNPYGQGNPTEKVAEDAPFSSFWPTLSRRGANFAETALTIGPVALVLLGLYWARRPRLAEWGPLAAVGAVGAALAIGTPLNRVLYFFAPGWSSTGSPGRILVLFVLSACVLAGLAVREATGNGKREKVGVAVAGIFAFLTLAPLYDAAPQGLAADAWAAITSLAWTSHLPIAALCIVGALAGALLMVGGRFGGEKGLVAATVAILALSYVPGMIRTGDAAFLRESKIEGVVSSERVAVINGPWDIVQATPALYPPNTLSVSRIHDLGGYDSLLHRDTVGLLREINRVDPAPPANGNMMFVKRDADPSGLAEAGVTTVLAREEIPAWIGHDAVDRSEVMDNGVVRYTLKGPGRVSVDGGSARIEAEDLNSIRIAASGPGTLTLRDRNMPGWIAIVNGKETPIQGDRWRAVELPAENSTVEFRYSPPGLQTGFVLSIISVAFVAFAVVRHRKKRVAEQV